MTERTFKLVFTESELQEKVANLRASQVVTLFLQVQEGQRQYEELQMYEGLLSGETKAAPVQEQVQVQQPAPVQQQAPAPQPVQQQAPNPYATQ